MHAFVVLGHAHFALSYWYQYKAGKVKKRYILPFILAAIFFLYLALNVSIWFSLFVVTFFIFHNCFDEFKLNGGKPTPEYTGVIFVLVSYFVGWSADFFLQTEWTRVCILIGVILAACIYTLKAIKGRFEWPIRSVYMWFLLAVLGVFTFLEFHGPRPDAREVVGAIILFHYFSWYIRLAFRFKEDGRDVFMTYLKRVFIANAVFISGYIAIVVVWNTEGLLYQVTYRPFGFYAWTLLHLITTFRLADYKSAFSFSKI